MKKYFCKELLVNKYFLENNFEEALKDNFLHMDRLLVTPEGKKELSQLKNDDNKDDKDNYFEQDSYAGCTANVALIYKGTELYVANAGDSRCVLSCNDKVDFYLYILNIYIIYLLFTLLITINKFIYLILIIIII